MRTAVRRRSNSQHQVNERMMARWTRHVGLFTGALVIVGIVTAVIFGRQLNVMQGQLREMQSASVDMKHSIEATNRLADEAKRSADNAIKTAERELRAYVGVVGDVILKCPLCDTTDINKPIEITREHIADNVMTIDIENGGQTPAYEVFIEDGYWSGNFGQRPPKDFNYPIINPPTPFLYNSTGTLNPRRNALADMSIEESVMSLIIKARRRVISLFYYGSVNYKDVFRKIRTTPFCLEYVPDFPTRDQFINCPEHNSPEQDK